MEFSYVGFRREATEPNFAEMMSAFAAIYLRNVFYENQGISKTM